MVLNLTINKIKRNENIPNIPAQFNRFQDLNLQFLEIPKKLKKNVPIILLNTKVPKHQHSEPRRTRSPSLSDVGSGKDEVLELGNNESNDEKNNDNTSNISIQTDDENLLTELNEDKKDKILPDNEQPSEENPPRTIPEDETNEEQGDNVMSAYEEKEEYLLKFRILRRTYPNIDVPEFTEYSDLETMKKSYDRTLRDLSFDDNLDTYRTYLKMGFLGVEFVCTRGIGIDMTGFASSQITSMNKYDKLLIELGEKNYASWGSNFPVEVRLLGTVLIQAMLFYITRMIGAKIGDIFRVNPQNRESQQEQQSHRMKGPSISPEDIKNMNNRP